MLRECIERVLAEYPEAKDQPFANHPLAIFLRKTFPRIVSEIIQNTDQYKVVGSPGQGNWADCPWVAILDIVETSTVQTGFYPVYLFKEDMSGLYLSLNQGVTSVYKTYGKKKAIERLLIRATDFRACIESHPKLFNELTIKLSNNSQYSLMPLYEAGSIFAKYYGAYDLPSEDKMISDLREMVELYECFICGNSEPLVKEPNEEEPDITSEIEYLTMRYHRKIDRNSKLAKKAKKIHGYNCQACGFSFEDMYGAIGERYIEAHHLQQISQFKGKKLKLSPKEDFAVLCSNCHKMIHKQEDPSDLNGFRAAIRQKAKASDIV